MKAPILTGFFVVSMLTLSICLAAEKVDDVLNLAKRHVPAPYPGQGYHCTTKYKRVSYRTVKSKPVSYRHSCGGGYWRRSSCEHYRTKYYYGTYYKVVTYQYCPSHGSGHHYPGTSHGSGHHYPGTSPGSGHHYPGTSPGSGHHYPGSSHGSGHHYPGTSHGSGGYYGK